MEGVAKPGGLLLLRYVDGNIKDCHLPAINTCTAGLERLNYICDKKFSNQKANIELRSSA